MSLHISIHKTLSSLKLLLKNSIELMTEAANIVEIVDT